MQQFSFIILISLVMSCSGSSEAVTTNPVDTSGVSPDTAVATTDDYFVIDILPSTECIELTDETYIINDLLAHIESESTPGQNIFVVMSEDQDLYLEIGYDKTVKEESWAINLDVTAIYGFDVKLEFADFNRDDFKDELVIWWSKSDGTSGISSGYESSQSGVIIFDVMQRTEILNLIYDNHYSTYSAGENANTDDPDFHAKVADDSDWFICAYSHDVKLVNNEIQISNYYGQSEGMGECGLTEYAEGTYTFDVAGGYFKLKQ